MNALKNHVVVCDVETTGLDPLHDQIWEFAAVILVHNEQGWDTFFQVETFVEHDITLAVNLPKSFREDHDRRYDPTKAVSRADLRDLGNRLFTAKPRLVGAAPWFDADFLRATGISGWSHRLVDVETLAAGRAGRLMEGLADAAQFFGFDHSAAHTAAGDVETAAQIFTTLIES